MKFTIDFSTGDSNKPILDKIGSAGIDFLDMFREEYPQYNFLTYKEIRFYDYCPVNGRCVEIEITEKLARESGCFKGKTSLYVTVGDFFKKYVDMDVKEDIRQKYEFKKFLGMDLTFLSKNEIDYVYGVDVRYSFNTEAMLKDWKEAGFPLVWK